MNRIQLVKLTVEFLKRNPKISLLSLFEEISHELQIANGKGQMSFDQAPENFVVGFGRKYKGKRLRDIPEGEIKSYIRWLENEADIRTGSALSVQLIELKEAVVALYGSFD